MNPSHLVTAHSDEGRMSLDELAAAVLPAREGRAVAAEPGATYL